VTRSCLPFVCVLVAGVTGAASSVVTPEQAVAAAVVQALGARAAVSVTVVETAVAAESGLIATPDAAARFSKPSRFVLSVRGVRRGLAVATVRARAPLGRAVREIIRNETVGRDAVEFVEVDLPRLPIAALLSEADVVGRTAKRTIAAREPLTASMLRLPPAIRSGDEVMMTVQIGAVRVTGSGRASGSGHIGDTIRVIPPNSVQVLPARIVGPGRVEILR
jgi:flagella basal body P-ring formation protein FlgA